MEVTIPKEHKIKVKADEKLSKYVDLTRELKKMCNMIVVPIVIGVENLDRSERSNKPKKNLQNRRNVKAFYPTELLKQLVYILDS